VVGVGDPEDGGGLGGAEGPEADPEAEVAVEAAQATLVQALRGEQQMHAEAPPDPADGREEVQELGSGGQQLAELVDDDHQVRQRFQPRVDGTPGGVGTQVRLVAGVTEQPLAPGQLTLEGGHGAVDHRQVGLEIGDQAGDLWEQGQVGERGTALEVDEHEGQLVRRMGRGQAGDDRAEQLALARPGGPDDQAVGTDPGLGGLLEVEDQRVPFRGGADRDLEKPRTVSPEPGRPKWSRWFRRSSRRTGPVAVDDAARPSRRSGPSRRAQGLTECEVGRVGVDAADQPATRRGLLERGRAPVVEEDADGELGRLAGNGPGKPDDRDPGRSGISSSVPRAVGGRLDSPAADPPEDGRRAARSCRGSRP
jgi:hypothetical protein